MTRPYDIVVLIRKGLSGVHWQRYESTEHWLRLERANRT